MTKNALHLDRAYPHTCMTSPSRLEITPVSDDGPTDDSMPSTPPPSASAATPTLGTLEQAHACDLARLELSVTMKARQILAKNRLRCSLAYGVDVDVDQEMTWYSSRHDAESRQFAIVCLGVGGIGGTADPTSQPHSTCRQSVDGERLSSKSGTPRNSPSARISYDEKGTRPKVSCRRHLCPNSHSATRH